MTSNVAITGGSPVRLAMLAVYHFDPFLQQLVEIHLDRLRRHAPAGSVILGAPIRLDRSQQAWLAAQPDVELPAIGPLPMGRREEHNAALDALARIAFRDGATHVATFHQDSFPVSDDWFPNIVRDLDAETVFAAAEPRAYNCCMLWDRAWQDEDPKMLIGEADYGTGVHAKFMAQRPDFHARDGGIGHLVLAASRGLRWRPLRATGPDLLDGTVIHLTGSTRLVHAEGGVRVEPPTLTALRKVMRPIYRALPTSWRGTVRHTVTSQLTRKDWATPVGWEGSAQEKRTQLERLLADPDGYIAAVRSAADRQGAVQLG